MKKDLTIETIRGIALILMLMGHIIGMEETGMKVAEDSVWQYFSFSFMYIRMPLFTSISGYVYSLRPINNNITSVTTFFKGKARRILLPLIFVGTIQYLFQCFTPNVNSSKQIENIWRIFIFPYSHFWFLQALFIVFIIVSILDFFKVLDNIKHWLVVLIITVIIHKIINVPDFFSLRRAFYLLPFFILGCGIKRHEEQILGSNIVVTLLTFFLCLGMLIQQFVWFDLLSLTLHEYSFLGVIIGLTGVTLIFKLRFKSYFLSYIGYYSFGIYLFHLFGSASSRILLEYLSLDRYTFFVFIIGLVFGILVPVIMEKVIIRFKVARLLFLGLKRAPSLPWHENRSGLLQRISFKRTT